MTEEVFDLDAARAADADASRQPFPFRFGGKVFHIPRPLPLKVSFAFGDGDWKGIVRGLFGDQADEVLDLGLSSDDAIMLVNQMLGGQGKSKASHGSSPTGGRKSKPTSNGTTESTPRDSPVED